MSAGPQIEELSTSSEEDFLDFSSEEAVSNASEDQKDPLVDFETITDDSARQSREAAANGTPIDMSQAVDMTEPKEEVLIVEELPEEEMKARLDQAESLKVDGNALYQASNFHEAIEKYTQAIDAAPKNHPVCAVFLSNRAACHVGLGAWRFVIEDTTLALKLQPNYIKAIARRAHAHEELDHFQEALDDLKKLLELDPSYTKVSEPRMARLEKEIEEKRKKEQEEMMGQLKDMGNKFLGLFGLSLDNFKAEKDESGSYKINFSQK